MSIGLGIGGLMISTAGMRGVVGVSLPTQIGTVTNATVDPTFTTHIAGDLLIAAASAASGTKPTAGGSWAEWGSEVNGSRSISIFYLVATGPGHTITITGETGTRQTWVFRNAARDTINFSSSVGSGTTLTWEAQPTMTASSLVGGYIFCSTTQTDITAVLPSGMTERGNRDATPVSMAFDSNGSYLSSFAPSNGTFDTSTSGWIAAAFSIKGA